MTEIEQTISNLRKLKSFHNGSYGADIDRAIKALETTDKIEESNFSMKQYKADLQCAYECGYQQGYTDALNECVE